MNIQFPHQPGTMRLSGLYADSEKRRNLLARLAFADELKDLALSRGERIRRKWRLGQKRLHNRARNARAKVDLSATDLLNGVNQVSGRLILQDVSPHAGTKRLCNILILVVAGQQDGPRF